uniref:Uncharacterized protein n=1 Tax=Ursus maritimus TaxID=29073 RepID=A0A452UEQ5_URSMA
MNPEVVEVAVEAEAAWGRCSCELGSNISGERGGLHESPLKLSFLNRIIQTTTPSSCKAWVKMLQLSLWLITSSRLVLLRQIRKQDSP